MNKTIKYSFRLTVPVMVGYVFLGITLGLVSGTSGLDWWIPILMSCIIYSGALEFAAIPLLSASFDPIGALILGITISARHLFYGIPMLKKYDGTGKMKPFLIFGLTDETFSILSSVDVPPDVDHEYFYFFVTLFDYLYWAVGTVMGVVLGSIINVNLEGLDFVLTALFVVLFVEQIKTKTGLKSGIAGLVISGLALIIVGKEYFIIASMAVLIAVLLLGRRVIDRE